MRESEIEKAFVTRVKALGGEALKFVSPGNAGVPDRLVLMPGGRVWFAELKAPGEKPQALQERQFERLRRLGFEVRVIDSLDYEIIGDEE